MKWQPAEQMFQLPHRLCDSEQQPAYYDQDCPERLHRSTLPCHVYSAWDQTDVLVSKNSGKCLECNIL